jgi:hypothetical protein
MPRPLPDHLPIVDRRVAYAGATPTYVEREVVEPVDLCDARGRLNLDAVGWSRLPLVRANLRGHWPRKKRWNFWNWISPRFVFSVTLADIDYGAFCQTFIDFRPTFAGRHDLLPTRRIGPPEHVERSVAFRSRAMEYRNATEGGDMVDFAGARRPASASSPTSVRRPVRRVSTSSCRGPANA